MSDKEFEPKSDKARRNKFTIANPFITENVKVVDMDNLTDEQKAMPFIDHDYSFVRSLPCYDQYVEFAFCEYPKRQIPSDRNSTIQVLGERIFFKSYESAQEFFKLIDFIDYVCFQYEKGEETGLLHLQGFMRYVKEKQMKVVHKIFPTMSLKPCGWDTNAECREYCRKEHTRVEGFEPYEHGNFKHERQRTDLKAIVEDIKADVPYIELLDKYPAQMLNMGDKIEKTRQKVIRERFKNTERKIHVTYIYGPEGTGKTTFVYRVLGQEYKDVFKVSRYKHTGKYDNYACQDIIMFDEFDGQIELTEMNDMLNEQPYDFPCRFDDNVACFTKAIFTSNYPLADIYKVEREKGKERSYKGFLRRIKEIIYVPKQDEYVWELGQPSEKAIEIMTARGDKWTIKEQPVKQEEMPW